MVEHQGPRRHAVCEVYVNGQPISTKLYPYLISVQVMDNIEGTHSECHIELDDRNAELQLPPDGVSMQVAMGWAGAGPELFDSGRRSISATGQVIGQGPIAQKPEESIQRPWGGPGAELLFSGTVSEVESGFGRRGGGRRVWITATSGNVKGLAKEVQHGHHGEGKPDDSQQSGAGGGSGGAGGGGGLLGALQSMEGGASGGIPLEQVFKSIFGKAGITAKLSPAMKALKRDYWYINESPQNFGQRIANEVGGIFKIENGIASIVGRDENVNVDGDPLPMVEAVWGINLIGWRIKPYAGRPQYGATQQRFFDLFQGAHDIVKKAIGGAAPFGGTDAIAHGMATVLDKNHGDQVNAGTDTSSKSRRGTGWVLINGEPTARGGAKLTISNARPGVDGTYLITEAEHNYTRNVGYTTRLNVQYPQPSGGGVVVPHDPGHADPSIPPSQIPQQSTNPMAEGYVAPPLPGAIPGLTPQEMEQVFQDSTNLQLAAPPPLPLPTPPSGVGHN